MNETEQTIKFIILGRPSMEGGHRPQKTVEGLSSHSAYKKLQIVKGTRHFCTIYT